MNVRDVVAKSTRVLSPATGTPTGTLREVLDTLGAHAVRLVHGDDDSLGRPVGEPLVHGVGEPLQEADDKLVLLTGGRADRADTLDCIRQVAAQGGRAVVLKAWGLDLTAAATTAADAGVALLCTPDEMAWRHLDAMVTAAGSAAVRIGEEGTAAWSGDLFGLANAIAASLGGPVTIEDTSGRVMAYSNLDGQEIDEIRRLAILGRQTPERPTNAEEYKAIIRADGPVYFESSDPAFADRMAIAVRAGHQVLGLIFVLCDRPKLVDDAERVLTDAARTTALHLLLARSQHDPDRTRRRSALRGLLTGSLDHQAATAALGIAPTDHLVVGAVRSVSSPTARESDAARVADLVALHGEYWHAGTAAVIDGGDVVLLLPVSERAHDDVHLADRLRRLGNDVVNAARQSASADLVVGFGPVVSGAHEARRSRELAGQVLDVLQDPTSASRARLDSVATLADVRSEVVLAAVRASTSADGALQLDTVRAVLDHDAAHGTDYATTLLVHLCTFGNVVETARRLNVHDNTARYRVRRLAELFGIELAEGDETLVTWLQLRVALGAPVEGHKPST